MKLKHKKSILRFFLILFYIVVVFSFSYLFQIYEAQTLCSDFEKKPSVDRVKKSIRLYKSALLIYREPFVFEQLGILYYHLENYQNAYISFAQAISFRKNFPFYEYVKSIFTFSDSQITDWDEKQILMYYILGEISTKLENYNQCVDDYTKMFEVAIQQGKDALERENRGFCYYKLNMYQEAYKDCIEEKEWLDNKISKLPDNKLKEAYVNRVHKIDNLLSEISKVQGNN